MKTLTKIIVAVLLFFGILVTLFCFRNADEVENQPLNQVNSSTEETKNEEVSVKETEPQKETTITEPTELETKTQEPENYNLSWASFGETMYARCVVNVRSGPGIGYEKLGTLYINDQVKATRQANNGWTEIEWSNGTAFVFSNYISSEKTEEIKVQEPQDSTSQQETQHEQEPEEEPEQKPDNQVPGYDPSYPGHDGIYMGQLVSSLGFNIRLYKKGEVCSAQSIVDAPNSANYRPYRQGIYIADHKHQDNFSAIKNAVPGQSTFQIIGPEETWTYICTDTLQGHNTGKTITDEAGNDMLDGHVEIIMYTCNSNWRDVFITVWKRIS